MTTANGTFTSCGPNEPFSLNFTCSGPSCSTLNGFPTTTCTNDGNSLVCTNGVVCSGPTNYTSQFSFSQANISVSQIQQVVLKDCGSFTFTSDGTTGGSKVEGAGTNSCPTNGTEPSSSSSIPSTSTLSTPLYSNSATSSGSETVPVYTHTSVSTSTSTVKSVPVYSLPTSMEPIPTYSTKVNPVYSSTGSYTTPVPPPVTQSQTIYYSNPASSAPETSAPIYSTPTYQPPVSSVPETSVPIYNTPTYQPPASSPVYTLSAPKDQSSSATIPPVPAYTGGAPRRGPNRAQSFVSLLFVLSFLIPGVFAVAYTGKNLDITPWTPPLLKLDSSPSKTDNTTIDLLKRKLGNEYEEIAKLIGEYLSGKLKSAVTPGGDPELFADNLIAEVAEAVCDHIVGAALTPALVADAVDACIELVYSGNAIIAPELEFLSIFGASLLCNFLANVLVPQIADLTDVVCKPKKTETCGDLLTDPKNCGACGIVVSFSPSPLQLKPTKANVDTSVPQAHVPMVHVRPQPVQVKFAAPLAPVALADRVYVLARLKALVIVLTATRLAVVWRDAAPAWIAILARSVRLVLAVK